MTVNVLLITLDQFRGDCLSAAGHPLVRTPHLDALAACRGAVATPLQPGGAVRPGSGQPLHRHVPDEPSGGRQRHAARRPLRQRSPSRPDGPATPRRCSATPTSRSIRGSPPVPTTRDCRRTTASCPASTPCSTSPTTTSRGSPGSLRSATTHRPALWSCWRPSPTGRPSTACRRSSPITRSSGCAARTAPWFAHLSYLRPHPPYSAAGQWSAAYDPADVALPIAPAQERHRMHDMVLTDPRTAAPADEAAVRHMRAQYYGMISEVDDQLGRVWEALRELGMWDDTMIVVTSDHGEMLGDHGLREQARLLGAELPHPRHRPRPAPRRRARHGRRRVHRERRSDADDLRRDRRTSAGAVRRPAR